MQYYLFLDESGDHSWWRSLTVGTSYVKPESFANLGFTHKFLSKKQNVEGLQLADLAAYPIARHVINAFAENIMYQQLIPKFQAHKIKGIYGYGLKIFP